MKFAPFLRTAGALALLTSLVPCGCSEAQRTPRRAEKSSAPTEQLASEGAADATAAPVRPSPAQGTTWVPFELPRGYRTPEGEFLRRGAMRLATAADEIEPLADPRVRRNRAYLVVLLLARTLRLQGLTSVTPQVVEGLCSEDLAFLQDLYRHVNEHAATSECSRCGVIYRVDPAGWPAVPPAERKRTEFEFELPRGYIGPRGELHRSGRMRLATAADEILLLEHPKVEENRAYLWIVLLAAVVTELGGVEQVDESVIRDLVVRDLNHLQDFYRRINREDRVDVCPKCRQAGD